MSEPRQAATLLVDEAEFGEAAERMVQRQLKGRGIADRRVLEAMRSVPRHRFVDEARRDRAYDDAALPTIHGQTISQPYIVAAMTEMLGVTPEHNVLEIGTGTGYQTMILARMARQVVSIESDADLAEQARRTLERFGVDNAVVETGDGTLGDPERGPYDRIIVTAAAPDVPQALLDQLADPGRIIIPLGDRGLQTLTQIDLRGGQLTRSADIGCRFVPLVGEQGWANRG